jgi:hypothetical protein
MIGASLLAYGLVLNKEASIAQLAATAWGFNLEVAREIVSNRYDARFGLAALLLGFLLQFDGALGWESELVGVIGACATFLLFVGWALFRAKTITTQTARVVEKLKAAAA